MENTKKSEGGTVLPWLSGHLATGVEKKKIIPITEYLNYWRKISFEINLTSI